MKYELGSAETVYFQMVQCGHRVNVEDFKAFISNAENYNQCMSIRIFGKKLECTR